MLTFTMFIILTYLLVQNECVETSTYTSKYDGVNLEEILSSERLLKGYISCLLEKGPCTPDGKELKSNLPDAIENDCKKCTDRQRDGANEVMHYIIDNRPADWEKLEKKYNSDGSYKLKYMASKDDKTKESKEDDLKENED